MALNHIAQGEVFHHTPSGSTYSSGDPVVMEETLGVALTDIADGQTAPVAVEGVYALAKVTGTMAQGDKVYWDADGNPVGGDSGAGAITTTLGDGDIYAGKVYAAAASGDKTVQVKLNAA